MTVDLSTTNLLLGIMAVVSVLEALVVIGIGVAGFIAYRRVMTLLEGLENRQVAPAMARVNSILDDVKGVTTKVKEETNRVDQAIHTTIGRIDNTAQLSIGAKAGSGGDWYKGRMDEVSLAIG